eukprot:1043324-Pelagomonas_calceolata.AAC.4
MDSTITSSLACWACNGCGMAQQTGFSSSSAAVSSSLKHDGPHHHVILDLLDPRGRGMDALMFPLRSCLLGALSSAVPYPSTLMFASSTACFACTYHYCRTGLLLFARTHGSQDREERLFGCMHRLNSHAGRTGLRRKPVSFDAQALHLC